MLYPLRPIEAEVGMAHILIGKPADTEHLRLERHGDSVEQVCERSVARPLAGRAAGCVHPTENGPIRLDRRRQFHVRCRHHHSCG